MSLRARKRDPVPDDRSNLTVNKARQERRKEMIISNMINNARLKRRFGMELTPEEQWVLDNKDLFQ